MIPYRTIYKYLIYYKINKFKRYPHCNSKCLYKKWSSGECRPSRWFWVHFSWISADSGLGDCYLWLPCIYSIIVSFESSRQKQMVNNFDRHINAFPRSNSLGNSIRLFTWLILQVRKYLKYSITQRKLKVYKRIIF